MIDSTTQGRFKRRSATRLCFRGCPWAEAGWSPWLPSNAALRQRCCAT